LKFRYTEVEGITYNVNTFLSLRDQGFIEFSGKGTAWKEPAYNVDTSKYSISEKGQAYLFR